MNWKMNISIVDSGANEIFFEKMDGAYPGSRDIAFHKAQTAAHFPSPTRVFQEVAFGNSKRGHGACDSVRPLISPYFPADYLLMTVGQSANRRDRRQRRTKIEFVVTAIPMRRLPRIAVTGGCWLTA